MNPLTPLTYLANALPTLLSSVSNRIETYFSGQGRLQPQFIFPTLAFLLGCLGLAMGIVGPDKVRALWDGLNGDIKLLLAGLAALLFIVLETVSRQLALTVRRLYSGEWPAWSRLQAWGRRPFLEDRLAREAEQRTLQIAQDDLRRALQQLQGGNAAAASAAAAHRLPVLRVGLGAYQCITAADWVWATVPAAEAAAAVTSPAQLVGRYTRRPVAAAVPIPLAAVQSLPDLTYLDATRRQLVTVMLYPEDVGATLPAGSLAQVQLIAANDAAQSFEDILVVDRPTASQWVLSVPRPQAEILAQAVASAKQVTLTPAPSPRTTVVALPVASRVLAPGQLITAADIGWEAFTLTYHQQAWIIQGGPPYDQVITQADELLTPAGVYFWPESLNAGPPLTAWPVKCPGDLFARTEVQAVPSPSWLTFETPAGQLAPRRATWLPLTPQVREALPVATGDRVRVLDNTGATPNLIAAWCYVYRKLDGQGYYLAVAEAAAFDNQARAAGALLLSPFVELPVLRPGVTRQPGELIDAGDVHWQSFQANDLNLLNSVCLTAAEAVDHYVLPNGPALRPDQPIPCQRLGAAYPANAVTLDLAQATLLQPPAGLQRGDLVRCNMAYPNGNLIGEQLFLIRVQPAGQEYSVLEAAIPPQLATQARALLATAGVQVTLAATHSDAQLEQAVATLEQRLQQARQEAIRALSATLSARDPEEQVLARRAQELRQATAALEDIDRRLRERPWMRAPQFDAFTNLSRRRQALHDGLLDVVSHWRQALLGVLDDRMQGSRLSLPENLATTRPTRLGNILAAAAEYPLATYGIHTPTILPRLLQVLGETSDQPDPVVNRLVNAEASLNMVLLFSFWSAVWALLGLAAFILWGAPAWLWLLLVVGGPFIWWLALEGAVAQGYAYSEALKSLFDQRRQRLFISLGLALPDRPGLTLEEERGYWRHLYQLFALAQPAADFPPTRPTEGVKDA